MVAHLITLSTTSSTQVYLNSPPPPNINTITSIVPQYSLFYAPQMDTPPPRNHYTTLSLPPSLFSSGLTPEEIKQTLKKSYRRALLAHHPDKSTTSSPSVTIDEITLAYTTLSTPSLRQAHDLSLSSSGSGPAALGRHKLQTGIETIDLDDLTHHEGEEEDEWYKPCRCGNPKGFLVYESDLEEAANGGLEEVVVGCQDCSLWLRVVFGVVVQDQDQEGETPEQKKGETPAAERG